MSRNSLASILSISCAVAACTSQLSGCASVITEPHVKRVGWAQPVKSDSCEALSGTYLAYGLPAPENAIPEYFSTVWPSEGSLLSLIELASNAPARKYSRYYRVDKKDVLAELKISAGASTPVTFEAKNGAGQKEDLAPADWKCEQGVLEAHTRLDSPGIESRVYLWTDADSLLAEQYIYEVSGKSDRQTVARLYFRFPRKGESPVHTG